MHKNHKDKSTSYHTGSSRNWVNCYTAEFASPLNMFHMICWPKLSWDQWRSSCLVESLLWTLRKVKKMTDLYRREFQGNTSAELMVIYIRKDLLRACKAIFLQAASLVLSWELCIGTLIYRSGHTSYFSHYMWDWIVSLGNFKVLHLSKNNSEKGAGLTLLHSGNQSTFPGAPGLYGPALKFRFLPATAT